MLFKQSSELYLKKFYFRFNYYKMSSIKECFNTCFMDSHGMKQFNNSNYTGTQIMYDVNLFTDRVNESIRNGNTLKDGYAPFCKHVFIPNFANVKCGYVEITDENRFKQRVQYEGRNAGELPVLVSYFDKNEIEVPEAKYLDIILYSNEQIQQEYLAMGKTAPMFSEPWGIISVKGQMVDHELPMQPITMMRNALGKSEGGSGVPLNRELYMQSVKFWENHASLK